MFIPCDKTFHMVPKFLTSWPWPWSLTYFWKTLSLAITFLPEVIGLSYCTCIFLVTKPFTWYHNFCPPPFAKAGDIKSHSSVRPSVRHKNFNLAHIFWSINDRALIFGMHDPCDRPFQLTPCRDLDLDLWPNSRSNLFPGGGPQFSEFACRPHDLDFEL